MAMVLAGCGGDGDDPAGEGETSASELTKSPIKIGYAVPETGPSGSVSKPSARVAAAWQEWVNRDQGGINGHPVEVIVKDTKSEPATGLAVVREMVERDEIVALLSSDSTADFTYVPYAHQQGVPVVGVVNFVGPWRELTPGVFPTAPTCPACIGGQVAAAAALDAEAFGAASCAENPTCAQADPLYAQLVPTLGMDYAGLVKVAFAQPNYTAECLQLMQRNADFIQFSASGELGKRMKNDCIRQGYDGFFGASGGTASEDVFGSEEDMKLAGWLQGFPWWADAEPVEEFRNAQEKYNDSDEYRDGTSTATWAALELLRTALADVSDNPTTAEVMDSMYALDGEDVGGLLPEKVTYVRGQAPPEIQCYFLYQMEDGEFSSVEYGASGNNQSSGDLKSSCWPRR